MLENIFQPASREQLQRDRRNKLNAKNRRCDEKIQKLETEGVSRRGFLKLFGLTVAAVAGGAVLKKAEFFHDAVKPVEMPEPEENLEEEIFYDGEEPDIEAIKNIFNFNTKGRVEINLETAEKLKDYWKHQYATKMEGDLIGALERMKPLLPELRSIFRKYDVPEEYALLAIPESHWKLDALSLAGAEGPYQFMPETGKEYGLMTKADRQDPYKSADACARFLRKLFQRTGDWRLALSGYNGGYMGRYLISCRHKKTKPGYEQFLVYLTEEANHIKSDVRESLSVKHRVVKGNTLLGLSKKYNLGVEAIKKHNGLKNNDLRIGQIIRIPTSDERKSKLFGKKIRGISENLNYPPKFIAVFELIQNTLAWQKGSEAPEKV